MKKKMYFKKIKNSFTLGAPTRLCMLGGTLASSVIDFIFRKNQSIVPIFKSKMIALDFVYYPFFTVVYKRF